MPQAPRQVEGESTEGTGVPAGTSSGEGDSARWCRGSILQCCSEIGRGGGLPGVQRLCLLLRSGIQEGDRGRLVLLNLQRRARD